MSAPRHLEPEDVPTGMVAPGALMLDAVARLFRGAYQTGNVRLRPWNVTLSTYAALRVMADHPDLTLVQLSRRQYSQPQTMTRIVTELVKRGWVERRSRADDGRVRILRVTHQGSAVLEQMGTEVNKISATILQVLDEEQIDLVEKLVRACSRQVRRELETLDQQTIDQQVADPDTPGL